MPTSAPRSLTVAPRKRGAALLLSGPWLVDVAGFTGGEVVDVQVEAGRVVIRSAGAVLADEQKAKAEAEARARADIVASQSRQILAGLLAVLAAVAVAVVYEAAQNGALVITWPAVAAPGWSAFCAQCARAWSALAPLFIQ